MNCFRVQEHLEKYKHPSFRLKGAGPPGSMADRLWCAFDIHNRAVRGTSMESLGSVEVYDVPNTLPIYGEVPFTDYNEATDRIYDCGGMLSPDMEMPIHIKGGGRFAHVHFIGESPEVRRCLVRRLLEKP